MKEDAFAALRIGTFRRYLSIRFSINMAFRMQELVTGFYLYHLTRNPMAIGMVGLVEVVPFLFFALYGGYIADRTEKRKTLFMVFGTYLFTSAGIFLITQRYFPFSILPDRIVLLIYALVFLNGIASAFLNPAWFLIFKKSLPDSLLANASSWNSANRQLASILGPALGGLVYGFFGISWALGFVLVLILLSIILNFFLDPHPPHQISEKPIQEELWKGLQFVVNNPLILHILILDLFAYFFGGAIALLPVFAQDILHVGAQGLGIMRSSVALGSILSLMILTRYSPLHKPWRNLMVSVFAFGLSVLGFALSRDFYWTLGFLFLQGAFDSIGVVIKNTVLTTITPPEMGGRVSSVGSIFLAMTNEIGEFESGTAAKLMGTVPSVLFGGSMTLIAGTFYLLKNWKWIQFNLDQLMEENARGISPNFIALARKSK